MYATTRQFLDYFNLTGLDELPPLSEVRDLEEIGREIEQNIQGEIQFESSRNDSSDGPGESGNGRAAESEQTLH
jgi:segregation and condensation protein B